jgi:TonB family protein
MRNLLWIVLAVSLCISAMNTVGQTNTHSDSSSVSTAPATPADDPAFAEFQLVTKGVKPPKAVSAPDPKYPELPADAEDRGTVVMLIGVTAKGRVQPVRVLRSDEPAFEKIAVETVKKWKFKPAEKDGHPMPVQVTVEMRFQK